jgi:hypothetical protein
MKSETWEAQEDMVAMPGHKNILEMGPALVALLSIHGLGSLL